MFKQIAMGAAIAVASSVAFSANTQMQIKTTVGNIDIELYDDKAPITVKNFKSYAQSNFYNGTIFHRVIPGFMIQGGGMDVRMNEKATKAPIRNEANNGLKNTVGTLAMARTNDPNSASSQFFINVANNDFLDRSGTNPGYAVFGKVTSGMEVVKKITETPTGNKGMHQNVPKLPIQILSVTIKPTAKK